MSKPKKEESTGEIVRSLGVAILIALVFRSIAFEPFHIPSGSMLSTLYKGDYIFVTKYAYGYSQYSFPLSLKLFEGRAMATEPKRGDVVVFRPPKMLRTDYIKRVVGLPGDTIQMKHGRLFINGKAVEVTRREDVSVPDENGQWDMVARYDETMPEGRSHVILDDIFEGPADNTPVYKVPQGHYFMMGDNRDHSQDSRYESPVGYVPFENIVGRADMILLSYDERTPIWKIWKWGSAFRSDRWFKKIV